ncbi:MAG: helicase-related protein [Terriglobia bacterium]
MPRIFDNIESSLLNALKDTLALSERADFCVGYFNLRGWKQLDSYVERWCGGDGNCCRLLVGMQGIPQEELRSALSLLQKDEGIDQKTALRLKKQAAMEFREQLAFGAPSDEDESGLRRLAKQIKAKKVIVKLYLRHPLHAKLYLLHRTDPNNPSIGFVGSSNLTFAGLVKQGELNVDVLDHDACKKLQQWFEERWNDRWCLDISDDLVEIIDESWAREEPIPPYQIYLKMAYHLSQEARAGLTEFRIPSEFGRKLFEFQTAAVKIAAHHLNKRGGVLIGDVVGLGKTLMASAVAKIFEEDQFLETLIICPKNLVSMWEDYRDQYRLHAKVLSISRVSRELPNLRRYRLVLIDESHNLRNREGKRYRAIQEYIKENESKVILLSATPYNKTYLDLSNQLRLFIEEDKDLGMGPENLLRELGEMEFMSRYQCGVRTLAGFEKSLYPDDWRDLMRLYLVRRTRGFIQDNYASIDCPLCGTTVRAIEVACSRCGRKKDKLDRRYLTFSDGSRSYFPKRDPQTVKFKIDDKDPQDQYAKLYAPQVVDVINSLNLPRYGLGNYIAPAPHEPPTQTEAKALQDLSRAGKRLMGFCRTNIFKRLESGGEAFIQSIERHILRNHVYLYAIENDQLLPLGTQDASMLDSRFDDTDEEASVDAELFDVENGEEETSPVELNALRTEGDFKSRAAELYQEYRTKFHRRFKWLRPSLFVLSLQTDLDRDASALLNILQMSGEWNPNNDAKLEALFLLLTRKHPYQKVIVFTQFADTVNYLETQLRSRGIGRLAGVTGDSPDPTAFARRFSPVSNGKRDQISPENELRVLIATDVLSEGQNLQDCFIIVNYDLPWAIIRLIQRAGRVDRIGQQAEEILCYSFLPADGVERIIRLRSRVRERLRENAEVVGTDEAFFEDDRNDQAVVDLYNEKSGILDGDADTEVDLASYAFQIWQNAITADPSLQKTVSEMPPVVFSTRPHQATAKNPEGVLVYLRTADGNDALAWVDKDGNRVTESQLAVLQAAECPPDTPSLPRLEKHHALVRDAVKMIAQEEKTVGGQLGRPSGARFRTFERLKRYAGSVKGTLFESQELLRAIDEIYRYPLRQAATDTLNRQLRSGISDEMLAQLVLALRDEDRLCLIREEEQAEEPRIICSLGLKGSAPNKK